ncbi:hypothetical protein [Pulveribacter sp.]|uniref:hypothetical protein n=1 Tax=Pulveribacter sp. TaxID=2678893 RepID=UPI0028A7085E|nr:hypothetical protein [Pulveribacter sp.]
MIDFAEAFGGGGTLKAWASGMTVKQWETVVSALDGEVYRRKTATGAGATDPANDTTNYIAVSYNRVTTVGEGITGAMAPGWTADTIVSTCATKSSPAFSSGVRVAVLNISGRGALSFLALRSTASLSANVRMEVYVDARKVFDATTPSTITGSYWPLVGNLTPTSTSGDYAFLMDSVAFRRSVEVYVTVGQAVSAGLLQVWSKYRGVA